MVFDWDTEKNLLLKKERDVCFEQILVAIEEGHILDVLGHPNRTKYKNQLLLIVELDGYAFVVPTVVSEEKYFLKTIFPSRKYTDIYLPFSRRVKDE